MTIVLVYFATALVFLSLDMIGLRLLIYPVFERHIGHLLVAPPRLGAAAAFYLAYVGGVVCFVSLPALRHGAPLEALGMGAALGLMCYGTYEFTNYATLKGWSLEQVAVDCLWARR